MNTNDVPVPERICKAGAWVCTEAANRPAAMTNPTESKMNRGRLKNPIGDHHLEAA